MTAVRITTCRINWADLVLLRIATVISAAATAHDDTVMLRNWCKLLNNSERKVYFNVLSSTE